MSEPLVIVGNGMAAARLVDELAKVALGRYAIAVIGERLQPVLRAAERAVLACKLAWTSNAARIGEPSRRPSILPCRWRSRRPR